MTGLDEMSTTSKDVIKYRSSPNDPGRLQLSRNMTSKSLVRIVRSYKLKSNLAPKAGLRYDGL